MFPRNLSNNTAVGPTTPSFEYPGSNVTSPEFIVGIIASLLALGGNVVVLETIYGTKSTNRRRSSRTANDILIGALSATDILFVFFIVVVDYLKMIPRSQVFCAIVYPLYSATFVMSMFTLAAMANLRRRVILNPFMLKPSTRSIYMTIACLWALALLVMAPFAAVLRLSNGDTECSEHWPSQDLNKAYTVALAIIMYVIPITVICISYIRITLFVRKHARNAQRMRTTSRRHDREVMKASLILVVLYTSLTLPHQIAWILVVFQNDAGNDILKYTDILVYAQSLCNPLVYGVITSRFRRAFVRYLAFCGGRWYRVDLIESRQRLHYDIPGNSGTAPQIELLRLNFHQPTIDVTE